MWRNGRDRIDAAIDEVAQRMTEGTPGSNFKARVLARIDHSRAGWRLPWVLAPLAVAAVVLIALMVYRGRPLDRDRPPSTSTGAVQSAGNTQRPGERIRQQRDNIARLPPPGTAERRAPPERRDTRRRNETSTFATASPSISAVIALAPPALEIESIDLERLAPPEPLIIQRLETTSIALTPIGEGDRP